MAIAYIWRDGCICRVERERILSEAAKLSGKGTSVLLCNGDRKIFVTQSGGIIPSGVTAVSCGMSEKDSVSISANSENAILLSVRRCLPTLSGGEVCVQDIALKTGGDAADIALRGGTLLCLGVEPEKLGLML